MKNNVDYYCQNLMHRKTHFPMSTSHYWSRLKLSKWHRGEKLYIPLLISYAIQFSNEESVLSKLGFNWCILTHPFEDSSVKRLKLKRIKEWMWQPSDWTMYFVPLTKIKLTFNNISLTLGKRSLRAFFQTHCTPIQRKIKRIVKGDYRDKAKRYDL